MTASLSVVMAVHDEVQTVAAVIGEIRQHILPRVPDAEILVVDDGSRDGTGALLDELSREEVHLHIFHQTWQGHGPAVRRALDLANGEWVLLLNSQGQIALNNFSELWAAAQDVDVVFGVRTGSLRPFTRWLRMLSIRGAMKVGFHLRLSDANCPFKLLHRSVWQKARDVIPPHTLIPSLLLAIYIGHSEWRWRELPVAQGQSPIVPPGLGGAPSVKRYLQAIIQLWRFHRLLAWNYSVMLDS